MKRNLLLSTILVIIVSLVFTGAVMAQEGDPESGYPIEYPHEYDWEPIEGCIEYAWTGDCIEFEDEAPAPTKQPEPKSEPASIKRSKWVEPPVIAQVKQVVQKSIMELIQGLRLMLRMR